MRRVPSAVVCVSVQGFFTSRDVSCAFVLSGKGLGRNFLRVTLCLVRWFLSRCCLRAVFGAELWLAPQRLVHMDVCFLTVSKISTGDGMRGFGCREAEGLPVSCCMYVRVCGYG